MIWSSRARNRSFDPVVLCFFGRIVPPMHHRIMAHSERESKNEFSRFGALKLPIPAISNASASEKQTPAQSLRALFTDDFVVYIALTQPRRERADSSDHGCRVRLQVIGSQRPNHPD